MATRAWASAGVMGAAASGWSGSWAGAMAIMPRPISSRPRYWLISPWRSTARVAIPGFSPTARAGTVSRAAWAGSLARAT